MMLVNFCIRSLVTFPHTKNTAKTKTRKREEKAHSNKNNKKEPPQEKDNSRHGMVRFAPKPALDPPRRATTPLHHRRPTTATSSPQPRRGTPQRTQPSATSLTTLSGRHPQHSSATSSSSVQSMKKQSSHHTHRINGPGARHPLDNPLHNAKESQVESFTSVQIGDNSRSAADSVGGGVWQNPYVQVGMEAIRKSYERSSSAASDGALRHNNVYPTAGGSSSSVIPLVRQQQQQPLHRSFLGEQQQHVPHEKDRYREPEQRPFPSTSAASPVNEASVLQRLERIMSTNGKPSLSQVHNSNDGAAAGQVEQPKFGGQHINSDDPRRGFLLDADEQQEGVLLNWQSALALENALAAQNQQQTQQQQLKPSLSSSSQDRKMVRFQSRDNDINRVDEETRFQQQQQEATAEGLRLDPPSKSSSTPPPITSPTSLREVLIPPPPPISAKESHQSNLVSPRKAREMSVIIPGLRVERPPPPAQPSSISAQIGLMSHPRIPSQSPTKKKQTMMNDAALEEPMHRIMQTPVLLQHQQNAPLRVPTATPASYPSLYYGLSAPASGRGKRGGLIVSHEVANVLVSAHHDTLMEPISDNEEDDVGDDEHNTFVDPFPKQLPPQTTPAAVLSSAVKVEERKSLLTPPPPPPVLLASHPTIVQAPLPATTTTTTTSVVNQDQVQFRPDQAHETVSKKKPPTIVVPQPLSMPTPGGGIPSSLTSPSSADTPLRRSPLRRKASLMDVAASADEDLDPDRWPLEGEGDDVKEDINPQKWNFDGEAEEKHMYTYQLPKLWNLEDHEKMLLSSSTLGSFSSDTREQRVRPTPLSAGHTETSSAFGDVDMPLTLRTEGPSAAAQRRPWLSGPSTTTAAAASGGGWNDSSLPPPSRRQQQQQQHEALDHHHHHSSRNHNVRRQILLEPPENSLAYSETDDDDEGQEVKNRRAVKTSLRTDQRGNGGLPPVSSSPLLVSANAVSLRDTMRQEDREDRLFAAMTRSSIARAPNSQQRSQSQQHRDPSISTSPPRFEHQEGVSDQQQRSLFSTSLDATNDSTSAGGGDSRKNSNEKSSSLQCRQCGARSQSGLACRACGGSLPAPTECRRCGCLCRGYFCTSCGLSLQG